MKNTTIKQDIKEPNKTTHLRFFPKHFQVKIKLSVKEMLIKAQTHEFTKPYCTCNSNSLTIVLTHPRNTAQRQACLHSRRRNTQPTS